MIHLPGKKMAIVMEKVDFISYHPSGGYNTEDHVSVTFENGNELAIYKADITLDEDQEVYDYFNELVEELNGL